MHEDSPGIWSELRAQRDLLIEMKTKLDAVPDHENRIRKLEERRFPLQVMAIVISLVAVIGQLVMYVVK
ncbi:hypothetical protein [Streptomyces sp. S1]|uniref:hypothetical protein n=1 Tax=Streptomyces sp. S1 TaxID=718288 RepID=UPI003D722F09